MSIFNITEIFIKDGVSNTIKNILVNVTNIELWDLSEGLYVNDKFPSTSNHSLTDIPEHMTIQLNDDVSRSIVILSVVNGKASIHEYNALYEDIKSFIDSDFKTYEYEYKETNKSGLYEYKLEIVRVI